MNFEHVPDKLLITGKSGSGKTTLYIRCIRNAAERRRVVLVFDHEGELARRLNVKPARSLQEMNYQTATGVCLYDPSEMFPGRLPAAFNFFCDYAFIVAQTLKCNKVLCCDELQKLTGTNTISKELCTVLETGRRYELDFFCISQSPNLIHTRIRNQLTKVAAFTARDKRALEFLGEAGFDVDQVRALLPGQFIARDLDTGQQFQGEVFKANHQPKGKLCHGVLALPATAPPSPKSSTSRQITARKTKTPSKSKELQSS